MSSNSNMLSSASSAPPRESLPQMPIEPILAGVFEILLCIDLNVATRRIDVGEALAALNHFLKQENEVRLFEKGGLAPRSASEFAAAAMEVLAQPGRAGG